MAYQDIINSVLRRLREDTISSAWTGAINDSSDVDDYQKLIGELVNEAKQLVEDSWDWTMLRTVVDVTTVAGTESYALTGVNDRYRILQVIDDTNDAIIPQMSDSQFYNYKYVGSQGQNQASSYRLNDTNISFFPVPDAAYTIRVHLVDPQDDLTLATDTLTVPQHPVILGAYSLALAERGEDGGTSMDIAAQRFDNALADAIGQDELRTKDETLWFAS